MTDLNQPEQPNQLGGRRTYQMMMEQINTKLSSKDDWYKFLECNL